MKLNDLNYQAEFVINSVPRVQSFQDKDLISPSFGSFCYNFWRDKTSDFSDARFQEVGATMGLLMLKDFDKYRKNSEYLKIDKLRNSFFSSLIFLKKIQNKNGSFDEWYKGENGFAATVFNLIAYGLTGNFLKGKLNNNERDLLNEIIVKASNWLIQKNDLVKTNHQVAASAALILAYKFTRNLKYKEVAKEKMNLAIKQQTREGWFPEVGGMDLGYCSVLLDYAMIYHFFSNDNKVLKPMKKLFNFMKYLIQPDLKISKEMGLCLNPYLSRTGIALLSQFDNDALFFFKSIQSNSPEYSGISPFLSDDLRLARWSYLPILNFILIKKLKFNNSKKSLSIQNGWKIFMEAKVCRYYSKNTNIFFSAAGGGMTKIYLKKKLILEDQGYNFKYKNKNYSHNGYDRNRYLKINEENIEFLTNFGEAKYYNFNFLSKIILRIVCLIPYLSSLVRSIVDFIRIKKQTALNQSNAPLANKSKRKILKREISFQDNEIKIKDIVKLPFQIDIDSINQILYTSLKKKIKVFIKEKTFKNEILITKYINLKNNFMKLEFENNVKKK